jgi:RNAse (barnase) inhibitor barstar
LVERLVWVQEAGGSNPLALILRFFGGVVQKPVLVIEGDNFSTLEEFYDEVERVLIPGAAWGRNLDAFNDILRGGFGTPEGGFVLRWRHSSRSSERLGYVETVRQLQSRLTRCHASNRAAVAEELEQAKQGIGPTVFEWLTEIIRDHGLGGQEAEDGVELMLE